MHVTLLSPPFVPEYMRNARCDFVSLSATQWYPILLGACGAYLEGHGHAVSLVDAPAHHLDHAAVRRLLRARPTDLLVLYTGHKSETNDLAFADLLVEELGCDAVVVGPFASIDPERTLGRAAAVDKLVRGEFERAVGELAAGRDPAQIRDLVRKANGGFAWNPARPCMTGEELDRIPFVSGFLHRQVDIRRYKTPSELHPFMDVLTGRGCAWGACTYCLWVHTYVKGRTYNTRSIPNVIEELRAIEREMPAVRSVMIQDDTFTEARARAFSEARLRAGLRLPWSCYARADMGYPVLALMKRAGCRNLHVGYESADPGVLKAIRKGLTVERMTRFTEDARRAGLRIHGDFALGFPGETPEKARATIRWACSLKPHTAQFQLMIPFPGTAYHAQMQEAGWLNDAGQPDMPAFRNDEIRATAKRAYRSFYFSRHYLRQALAHPREHVLGRLKTIRRALPAMFWKTWQV